MFNRACRIKTKETIRKFRLAGGWISNPPKGYSYQKQKSVKGIIIPNETAGKITWLFMEYATAKYNVQQLASISNTTRPFWAPNEIEKILKDVVYIGLVKVPNDDGTFEIVKGKHEAIISVELFNKVQEIFRDQPANVPLYIVDLKKENNEADY